MRLINVTAATALLVICTGALSASAEDALNCETLLKQRDETLQALQADNTLLKERIKSLESAPYITREALAVKNNQRLREIAADVKVQRQSMADFEGFVKWMTGNLSGYSKYVAAGSVAAGFAKVLPIPYAGQASMFTKFVSQGLLSLNAASVSINRYMDTSRQFIARVDALDQANPNPLEVSELSRFADRELWRDMNDARAKLAATSDISSSSLSFLQSLNHYIGSTDEYWNKTKSMLSRKEADKKEKSFLAESIQGLNNRAASFNARLKGFEGTAEKDAPLIKSLITYDEMLKELDTKQAKAR